MTRKRLITVLAGLLVLILVLTSDTARTAARNTLQWMADNPSSAIPVLMAGLLAAILLLAPTWMFMVAAGYLYGTGIAMLIIWPVYLFSAVITFYISRRFARAWAERQLVSSPRFRALDRAVGDSGFTVVLLSRVALVIPYNFLNYAFGATSVRFAQYFWGTALGSVVMVLVNVYVGASATSLAALGNPGAAMSGDWRFTVLKITVLLAVVLVIARFASRALDHYMDE